MRGNMLLCTVALHVKRLKENYRNKPRSSSNNKVFFCDSQFEYPSRTPEEVTQFKLVRRFFFIVMNIHWDSFARRCLATGKKADCNFAPARRVDKLNS